MALDKNPIEEAFGESDISSAEMQEAVRLWSELYREPYASNGNCGYNPHMAVAATLVAKLDGAMFSEYQSKIAETGNKSLEELLRNLDRVNSKCMQSAMVSGECLVKPIRNATQNNFAFTVIPRENYSVLGRDEFGVITDVGSYDTQTIVNMYYTLVERRTVDAKGYLTIQNKLFESDTPGMLGDEIPLGDVAQYASLKASARYPTPIYSIGLIQAKMTAVNMIDGSDDGISIFAPSAYTIQLLNEHEAQYKVEFKNARSRVIVSEEFLRSDRLGNPIFDDDLLMPLEGNHQDVGITIFNPEIRDESFKRRENDLLRMIENQNGLKRGMLSDVNFYQQDKSATEVNLSNGEFNLTILDLQRVWTQVVTQAFAICDVLGRLYFGWKSTATPALDYGDGVLYDRNRVFTEMYQLVTSGIMRPEVLLAWYYNMEWEPDDKEVVEAVQKLMPSMDNLESVGRGAL